MDKNNSNYIPDWENPQIFERNQVQPHTTLNIFDTREQALNTEIDSSSRRISLNGTWKFNWSSTPEQAPQDFYQKDYSHQDWEDISVPSNWQMQGFGYPLFRNVAHSFPSDPPRVPADFNPVGSYIRKFNIPEDWQQQEILLHFEGVKSASYVWINGEKVGYNQGGMEPAEYNITEYLEPGENKIAVQVLRYSDGTYLECQDMWRLAGIYRKVYLTAASPVHIRDFYVTTELDSDYKDGEIKVDAFIKNYTEKDLSNYKLKLNLYDEDKNSIFTRDLEQNIENISGNSEVKLSFSKEVKDPDKWSAEFPDLYNLTLELLNDQNQTQEVLKNRVGFREVEIKNQALYVNGKQVKLNGVNSHMQHPQTGRMMDEETMLKDLKLMKQFNINCVRTCHYPPNKKYLELADELGIYIFDETGDEAHANIYLSEKEEWKEQYLDRMRKMVYRDRNHPSVIVWSAGNESGWGENICSLIQEGKEIDPSRPGWMYGGNDDGDPATNPIQCEDIVGPRYARPLRLENLFGNIPESQDPRPSFMDEYLSAAGNSMGGLDEYWELIYKYPRLTGGAIWDWISPGLSKKAQLISDKAPVSNTCALMGRSYLKETGTNKVLSLSGHDEWVEVYRSQDLDITGDKLTLSLWVNPDSREDSSLITKGDHQFGIEQRDNKLVFYLSGRKKVELKGELPLYWINKWHQVVGKYNGEKMEIYIDGEKINEKNCHQKIKNTPYPVNIGRNAEIHGQSYEGKLFSGLIDRVRVFAKEIPVAKLYNSNNEEKGLKSKSKLWLDFEKIEDEKDFYTLGIGARSYGLVWPDRTVKPELEQVKKSAQPVSLTEVDLKQGKVKIENRHHFKNLKELQGKWELAVSGVNGEILQQGKLNIDLKPGREKVIEIPLELSELEPNLSYYLLIKFSLNEDKKWASSGHEIAWEQFELKQENQKEPGILKLKSLLEEKKLSGSPLSLQEKEKEIKIKSKDFSYTFSKKSGFLKSINYQNQELIREGLKFNVWRPPVANELDQWPVYRTDTGYHQEGMGDDIANGWRSIGLNNLTHKLIQLKVEENKEDKVQIITEYLVIGNNNDSGFKVKYLYKINDNGILEVDYEVSPLSCMTAWIPKIGLQMKLAQEFQNIKWSGRGPFENYPDRKTGAKIGIYESTVDEEYQPYLIPQDYGNKTDVKWAILSNNKKLGLAVAGKDLINFSVHKYDPEHLTRAQHTFQLEEAEALTLNIDHKVSGVGGTSISVLNKYKVLPEKYQARIYLRPFST